MEQSRYIEFQKTRDFGSLIGDTFDFIIKNFKPFAKNVLIIMTPNFLILFLSLSIFGIDIMKMYSNLAKPGSLPQLPQYFFGLLIVEMILGIFYLVLLICVNYDYIKLYIDRKGGTISVGDLWSEIKKDFFRVLLNLIGLFFILGIVTAVIIGIIAAIGVLGSETFAAVFGVLAAFILGTYLIVALWPVLFIIIHEKKRVFSAFFRSLRLVAGKWWFTFGLINVIMIIWMIFAMIASAPYYVVIFVSALHGVESGGIIMYPLLIVTYVFLTFFGSLMYMIPMTIAALHYFNLRERKEASSLFAKVENLEQGK
jgi:hypothetical protein